MLVNVGSGGGAAAAPAAGGAAAGGAAAAEDAPKEEEKAEEKEESDDGKRDKKYTSRGQILTLYRHGFRSLRLSACAYLTGAALHFSSFLITTKKLFYDWWSGSRGGYDGCRLNSPDLSCPLLYG